MKNTLKIKKTTSLALVATLLSTPAFSDLYIHPVGSGLGLNEQNMPSNMNVITVSDSGTSITQNGNEVKTTTVKTKTTEVQSHKTVQAMNENGDVVQVVNVIKPIGGDFNNNQHAQQIPSGVAKNAVTGSYGSQIPIAVAIKGNLPPDWNFTLEPSLEGTFVNWSTPKTDWASVITAIAQQNGLSHFVNNAGKTVAFSNVDAQFAKELSVPNSQVWQLKENKSLKDNLSAWAKQAGWSLHWDERLYSNYINPFDAKYVGTFLDITNSNGQIIKKGVVTQLLESLALSKAEVLLKPVFYKKNKVLVIEEASYQQQRINPKLVDQVRQTSKQ